MTGTKRKTRSPFITTSHHYCRVACLWSWRGGNVRTRLMCRLSQTALSTTDRGGAGGGRGSKRGEESISKVESQSPITRPALICLENVTGLSGGVTFQFTSHFLLAQGRMTISVGGGGWGREGKEDLHLSFPAASLLCAVPSSLSLSDQSSPAGYSGV